MTVIAKKKLIEVALPLDAINKASKREKSIRHGHPSTLHLWWARRPLAAARAVIFAQMVDDPSANPDLFPTERAQERERKRLFGIIEELVQWENTTNEVVLEKAREEIWQSWRRACAENADHPRAKDLFDRHVLPAFHDPFAGGGSLPLEAQRLGLEAHASDLNPVAVLINKAMIEIPPKFAGKPPVNPDSRAGQAEMDVAWRGAQGLAEDVRCYGKWMRDEAQKRIGHLYPKVRVTEEMAKDRPDLESYVGRELTVIAWLWARTVKSPNPAFADVEVPLASTFVLSKKKGKEAYVQPLTEESGYRFKVELGPPPRAAMQGTKAGKSGSPFLCLMSGAPMPFEYLRSEAKAGRMGARLMAVVAEGDRGRLYLEPTDEHESVAHVLAPSDAPDTNLPLRALGFRVQEYGMTKWRDLFSNRQLVALTTFCDLVSEARQRIEHDAVSAGLPDDGVLLHDGGSGARSYAEAISVYLGLLVDQVANHSSSMCGWNNTNTQMRSVFARQAIPMVWDYAESNIFCSSSGSYENLFERQIKGFFALGEPGRATAWQADVNTAQLYPQDGLISTDPPYYDNIGYADLSDFFYIWLRRSLRDTFPELFATVAVPKAEELIASPYRHGDRKRAQEFFLDGMLRAMRMLGRSTHPAFPVTIYYAFKQSEATQGRAGSTGWHTFLAALVRAGLAISGTWPIRTEKQGRVIGNNTNALAASIALVCRPRASGAAVATRREFQEALRAEFPDALAHLQRSNIAPVDLAQASIGPGMAVFTRCSEVLNADGSTMSVSEALALINATLDEVLEEQEGDFDPDSRWALTWFEQHGYAEGEYGVAEQLSKAKNTSVDGLVRAGIIESSRGTVRIKKPSELSAEWDPATDSRLTVWEMTQHLIRLLESGGERAAGELSAELGSRAETARDLAYRLYLVSERKRRAADALAYNGLVQSWPEIVRIAGDQRTTPETQGTLDIEDR